ncbi:hypothetical protein ACVXHA_14130 [Escherichia coli]
MAPPDNEIPPPRSITFHIWTAYRPFTTWVQDFMTGWMRWNSQRPENLCEHPAGRGGGRGRGRKTGITRY